jgi:O-antigen/teichoic acid export membrane protein
LSRVTISNQPVEVMDQAQVEESAAVRGLFGRDMVYLAFWAMQIILAAALTPATTRLMGDTAFGEASAAVAVMQLLNCLFSFSLYTAVQRAYASEGGEDHAQRLVALAIILSLVTGAIAYATGPWWCPLIGLGPFPAQIRYAVLWAVMSAITGPALGLVRSRDDLRGFVAASFAQSIFAQALALGLVVVVAATASEYILGQLIGEVVTAIIALSIARPRLPRRAHGPLMVNALRFSSALVPAAIAGFLFDASDRIVINGDLGPSELSRYAVARNIGGFALVLLQLVSLVWMPRLFGIKDGTSRRNVLASSRDGLYVLVVAFVVAVTAASPVLLRVWAPPSYHPEDLLLITALIAAGALPSAAGMIYTQVLVLNDRTKAVALAAVAVALLNLGLNLIFVPILGIDGSAGITFFCYSVSAVFLYWMAGASAPPTNMRSLGVSIAGVAVCIASAGLPSSGVVLVLRLLVAAAAVAVFLVRLVALMHPAAHETLRHLVGRFTGRIR